VLVKPDRDLDSLSDEDRAQTFGTPVLRPISRRDRKPLTTHVPPMIVMPLHFSKPATTFTLEDAKGIMLSDFGEAFRPSTPDKRPRLGKDSHIPLYARAPEALFEPSEPMSFASDIWSLACAIWHVLGLSPLFSPGETRTDYRVAGFLETLEPEKLPQSWQQIWEREESVPGNSSLPKRPHDVDEDCEPPISSLFEEWTQQRRRKEGKPFEEAETAAILDFMKGMLKFDPNERWTIDQVLESDWMRKWALPALNAAVVSKPLDDAV
jgi:serine/threonine protein kinase